MARKKKPAKARKPVKRSRPRVAKKGDAGAVGPRHARIARESGNVQGG